MKEFFAEIDLKKAIIMGVSFIVFIAVASSLIFYYFSSTSDDSDDSDIVETLYFPQEDAYEVERIVKNFIKTSGNFGFNYEKAYEMNSIAESTKIALMDAHTDNPAFISRHSAYNMVRDDIAVNSPLYYPISRTLSWDNNIEVGGDFARLFAVDNTTVKIPETMGVSDFNSSSHSFIDVEISIDSNVSYASQTSNDATWNGEVQIYSKDFNNEEFTLRMILIDGEWKVYNIIGFENEFLLATWEFPEFDYIQSKVTKGFEPSGSFFIDLPYPPEEINTENNSIE